MIFLILLHFLEYDIKQNKEFNVFHTWGGVRMNNSRFSDLVQDSLLFIDKSFSFMNDK